MNWMRPLYFGAFLSLFGAIWAYYHYQSQQRQDMPAYQIRFIVDESSSADILDTFYLMELLNLSEDSPTSYYRFHCGEACQTLMESGLFHEVNIATRGTDTLALNYTLNHPMARLSDQEEAFLNSEGKVLHRRFCKVTEGLPELTLGLSDPCEWGSYIPNESYSVASEIISTLESSTLPVVGIDLSRIHAPSLAHREIIVELLNQDQPLYLRLDVIDWKEGIEKLNRFLGSQSANALVHYNLFDLRLPHLGYLESYEN